MTSHGRFLSIIFSLLAFAATSFGQANIGSVLKGVVTDPSGAPIPGASVTLTGGAGVVKVVGSDAEGRFSILGIQGGRYTIRVSSTGFSLFEQANFEIGSGKQISINAKLNIESAKQEITVTDTISIDLDASNNVGSLTLKGEDLAMLSDNPDDLQNELNALAGPAAGPNGAQMFIDGFSGGKLPPKASIREIRVNSNPFSAEYDRIGFGRIEIFTKPGSDKFRGQFFYNAGNNVLNSRNTFAKVRPDAYQNMLSGSISGPITKKSSFALDIDTRLNEDASLINATFIDSAYRPVSIVQNIGNPTRFWNITPRFDMQLSPKHTLTSRFSHSQNSSDSGGISTFTLPDQAINTTGHSNQFQLTHTWLASAKLINEDRFQFVGTHSNQVGNSGFPTVSVPESFTNGGTRFSNNFGDEKRYEYSNITSYSAKTHMIKFGGRIRGVTQNDQNTSGYNGSFSFLNLNAYSITQNGLANGLTIPQIKLLGGGAQQFNLSSGIPLAGVGQVDAGLFIQDDWRVKPNLSINTGLRYETQSNINNTLNIAPRFGVAWGVGKAGATGARKTIIRAGGGIFFDRFSEDLVLNAERLNGINQKQYIVNAPDFYPNFPAVDFLQQFARLGTTRQIDKSLHIPYLVQMNVGIERALPKNITVGINYNHTIGVHQLRSRNINTPLPGTYNPQNILTAVYPYGAAAGNLYNYEATGRFLQDQLVTNVSARVNRKLTAFGFYSLGKARGNTDGAGSFPNDTYDTRLDWGRSSYDIRHRGLVGGSITLPKGISLSPFMSVATGGAYNIVTGRDPFGDNQLQNHRPGIATGPGPGIVYYQGQYLDTNPKAGQTLLARNSGQSPGSFTLNLRVSRTWGFGGEKAAATGATPDMGGMMRGGMMGGGGGGGPRGGGGGDHGGSGGMFGGGSAKYNLTLSGQAQNLTNNVNYGPPVGSLNSPNFGISTSTGGGGFGGGPGGGGDRGGGGSSANRRISLSLRLSF